MFILDYQFFIILPLLFIFSFIFIWLLVNCEAFGDLLMILIKLSIKGLLLAFFLWILIVFLSCGLIS